METLGRSWTLAHVLIDCDIPVADGCNEIWAIIEFQRNVFSYEDEIYHLRNIYFQSFKQILMLFMIF